MSILSLFTDYEPSTIVKIVKATTCVDQSINQQQARDMLVPHKRLCNVNSSTDNPPLFFYYNENYKIVVIKIQFCPAKSWGTLLNVTNYGRQPFWIGSSRFSEKGAVSQGIGWLFCSAFIIQSLLKKSPS